MSFFAEAIRDTTQKSPLTPGPAQYNPPDKQLTTQCAPFNSSAAKAMKLQTKFQIPGPGHYKIAQQPTTNILTINNNQILVYGRERYQSVFNSRSQRFSAAKPKADTPGPGQYEVSPPPKLARTRRFEKSLSSAIRLNTQSGKIAIPSIPKNILGYKELKNGELIKIQSQIFRRQQPATVGTYNPVLYRKSNGVKWSRTKSLSTDSRLHTTDNANSFVGPGTYDVKIGLGQSLSSRPVTSSFKSTSKKSSDVATDSQKITPGPGAYFHGKTYIVVPDEVHFGSKSVRFMNPKTAIPGPGAYAPSKQSLAMKKIASSAAFNSSARKAPQIRSVTQVGPGSYEVLKQRKLKGGPIIGFEERFLEDHQLLSREVPGPGQYQTNIQSRPKTTVIMRPQTQSYIKKEEEVAPTATSYTVENFNISKRVMPSTAKTVSMISQEAIKHPFNSTADRFKRKSTQDIAQQESMQLRAAIGKLTDRLVIRQTKFTKQEVPFNTTTSRQIFKPSLNPGPSSYNESDSIRWVKPTFNTKGATQSSQSPRKHY